MDFFEDKLKNSSERQDELPEDFSWENMREGVYSKMNASPQTNRWKWSSLFILLLFVGCGGWFVLQESELKSTNELKEKSLLTNDIDKKQVDKKSSQPVFENSNTAENISKTVKKQTLSENIEQRITQSIETTDHTSINDFNSKISTLKKTNFNFKESFKTQPSPSTIEKKSNENQVIKRIDPLSPITALPALPIKFERNTARWNVLLTENKSNRMAPQFALEAMVGVNSWLAFSEAGAGDQYMSPFPGYAFALGGNISFDNKPSIHFGYQFRNIQQLFDYEGTKTFNVNKQSAVVHQVLNSVTGNVLAQTIQDTSTTASKYNRELKYNSFKLHAFYLESAKNFKLNSKMILSPSFGVEYLFKISGNGKTLNAERDVVIIDEQNPIYKNHQFALRLGLNYKFQIGENWSLSTKIQTAKYLSNWNVNEGIAKPMIYSFNLGGEKRF